MKKLLIIFAACILGMVACNDKVELKNERTNFGNVSAPSIGWHNNNNSLKTVIRHIGDCVCPNCVCAGCPCAGGICICNGISFNDGGPLNSDEGLFNLIYIDSEIAVLRFSQTTAINDPSIMPDDFVPIAGGDYLEFDSQICQDYGVNSIKIPAGNCVVDYSNSIFGQITGPYQWD